MNFKDSIERIEIGRKDYPGKVLVWVHGTGWPIKENDQDAFCIHMDDWYSICGRALSRPEYEQACQTRNIEPSPDDTIGKYGDCYGDFGMDHYHTNPENRSFGIRATLNQGRWFGMKTENPNIVEERREAEIARVEMVRLEALRKTYPVDLQAWIDAVGGLERIYTDALSMHGNNSTQLREEGQHFEWLIGHTCLHLGMESSKGCEGYQEPKSFSDDGVYPLLPEWWSGWREADPEHPINRIAGMMADRRIEPYAGEVKYMGYGEDAGDDVRQNLKEWLGCE